jgi:hypothetical protein
MQVAQSGRYGPLGEEFLRPAHEDGPGCRTHDVTLSRPDRHAGAPGPDPFRAAPPRQPTTPHVMASWEPMSEMSK